MTRADGALAPFQWASYFETGCADVDAQHRKLVDLVNALAARAAGSGALNAAELGHILDGLGQYARHHFATEEALMERAGLDPRHVDAHRAAHADFVEQVGALAGAGESDNALPRLYEFVCAWLTYHILDTDQAMARQLRARAAGVEAAAAFDAEGAGTADPGNAALIVAVRSLLGVIAGRNAALARANADLERRVEARTAELATAQARLREADTLAAVGQLAAGVAHEINNPIGFVTSNLSTLATYAERLLTLTAAADGLAARHATDSAWQAARQTVDVDFIRDDLSALLDDASRGLERVREIVQALQAFAAPSEVRFTPIALAPLLADLCRSVPTAAGQTVRWETCDTPPPVAGSAPQLREAFRALLDNGVKALAGQPGTVSVRCTSETAAIRVDVVDDGCGMAPSVRAHIFEPFFTTRPVGSGRGLGLSSAYRIFRQHGGRIEVRSAPGQGSTFQVWLPRLPAPDAAAPAEHEKARPEPG